MWGRRRRTALLGAAVLCLGIATASVPAGAQTVPTDPAPGERQSRDSIYIKNNREFNPANGVRSGSGTKSNPFLISNWDVDSIYIADTSKHISIRDNTVTNLTLNWNGAGQRVVNNDVGDLRVNQNVKRKGAPTSGLIANNNFGVVGQLRHFDGIFQNNVVGAETDLFGGLPFFSSRAVNFDGFNGARFRNNTIYGGYVEVRLHGHHHGSGFGHKSHNHVMPPKEEEGHDHEGDAGHGYEMVDHSQRFHEVWVTGNKIYAPNEYQALLYTDSAHSANDRKANSEQDPGLELPHVHHTRVHLNNNKLFGSGLAVDIFNAEDKLHEKWTKGSLEIRGNRITLEPGELEDSFSTRDGITVWSARHLHLFIRDNVVSADHSGDPTSAVWGRSDSGIRLDDVDEGMVHLMGNSVMGTYFGINARQMTKTVRWWIEGLKTSEVAEPIYYDNSVKNRPEQGP